MADFNMSGNDTPQEKNTSANEKPTLLRVGITHGDTNGVGYEIILKAFAEQTMFEVCTPVVFGSAKIGSYHRKALGIETQFINGLRYTGEEAIEVVQMVLAGKVNKTLVNLLESKGGRAIGLSGIDDHMIEAKVKDPKLGYVGEITNVNVQPILDMLEKGYIPIVSTVGCVKDGNIYNINADTAAAQIAGKMQAESLIMMTDISGICTDKDNPDTLIPEIRMSEAENLMKTGVITIEQEHLFDDIQITSLIYEEQQADGETGSSD